MSDAILCLSRYRNSTGVSFSTNELGSTEKTPLYPILKFTVGVDGRRAKKLFGKITDAPRECL
jgi:hypothetical protein